MDPAGLLLCITTLVSTLETLPGSKEPELPTLSSVRAETIVLQNGVQRIQEWLHFTDPASKSQVMPSLHDAIETVDATVQRLKSDVESIFSDNLNSTITLDDPADHRQVELDPIHNAQRMRRHLIDMQECVSLVNFTLSVCQLPIGQGAEREVRELKLGAKTMRRAQTSKNYERRSIVEQSRSCSDSEHSVDYESFLSSISIAEADLREDTTPPSTRHSHLSSQHRENEWTIPTALSLRSKSQSRPVEIGPSASTSSTDPKGQDSPNHRQSLLANGSLLSRRPAGNRGESSSSAGDSVTSRSTSVCTLEDRGNTAAIDPATNAVENPNLPPVPLKEATISTPLVSGAAPQDEPQTKFREKPFAVETDPHKAVTSEVLPQQLPAMSILRDSKTTKSGRTASTYDVMDKIAPLKQTLMTLGATEFLNVESGQSPAQPYEDDPPSYAPQMNYTPLARDVIPLDQVNPVTTGGVTGSFTDIGTQPDLIRLIKENRPDDLQKALAQGYNVNEVDPVKGRTLIMDASRLRRWEACQVLLRANPKPRLHLKDEDGNTALHLSAYGGDAEICQLLLDSGASGRECNLMGKTPLELAARSGNSEAVLCLLNDDSAHRSSEINDPTLLKAFLETVKLGDTTTAQIILSMRVQPQKMKEAWKPIAYAAQSGSIAMLDLVLGQKCNLKATSPDGWTALHFAASHGHLSMVERLLNLKVSRKSQTKKSQETALHLAAAAGQTSTALALIVHKASAIIMIKDADDQEPIHHAVRKGDMRLTSKLIEQGAKLKNETKFGWKPIHIAAAYGHATLVADFMTRGINIEEKLDSPSFKPEKRTNEAAKRGYWAEIRWPHTGARPLHLACEFGRDNVARMLISGEAKIDEGDSAGWKPLHHAAFSGRSEIVQLLLQRGAAPDAKTNDGFTPLALGFREQKALSQADIDERNRVTDMLQVAMLGAKTSRFQQLKTNLLPTTGTGRSRIATHRNLIWHRAQLAETLHQADAHGEGEEYGLLREGSMLSRQDTGASELDSTPSSYEVPATQARFDDMK